MLRPYLLPAVFLLATTVGTADAQRSAVVSVSAKVDGKTYDATGAGSCRHSPTAAIHNVPAACGWSSTPARAGAQSSV